MAVTCEVQDNMGLLTSELFPVLDIVVDEACMTVVMLAQAQAAVDTSAMRESTHRVTPLADEYASAVATAAAVNPKAEFFDKLEPEKRPGIVEGVAAVAVEYAGYLEYGTVHQGAQPFWTPAVELVDHGFADAVTLAIESAAKAVAVR